MTAQRLLKLLALISLAATGLAAAYWRDTGMAPPPVLLKVSLGAFAAAMLVGLIGQDTRPRLMLRFLAAMAALVAVVALVADETRGSRFTPLLDHMTQFAPSLVNSMHAFISRTMGDLAWSLLTAALSMPTFLLFALIALFCGFASRRRDKVAIYVN